MSYSDYSVVPALAVGAILPSVPLDPISLRLDWAIPPLHSHSRFIN
jgi:hypothetical protein